MEEEPDKHVWSDPQIAPYRVGVVVRVANQRVHPVWFLRAKGTNGCLRFGVFISATKHNTDLAECPWETLIRCLCGMRYMAGDPQPALTKNKETEHQIIYEVFTISNYNRNGTKLTDILPLHQSPLELSLIYMLFCFFISSLIKFYAFSYTQHVENLTKNPSIIRNLLCTSKCSWNTKHTFTYNYDLCWI